jgi:Domain of unknown function (DUF4145)
MKKVKIGVEVIDEAAWIFMLRSFANQEHNALDAPLHVILRWVIEQISFGCWQPRFDEKGEAVTIVIGQEAADNTFDDPIHESAGAYGIKRFHAIQIAGLFARARESGVPPDWEGMVEMQRNTAVSNPPSASTAPNQIDAVHPANSWVNTEFFYALQLVEVLRKLHGRMFAFSAPPMRGVLPEPIAQQLAEATRAHFYGLNRSAVAMSRAILEAALRSRIDYDSLNRHQSSSPGKGELQSMIDLASKKGMLTPHEHDRAHKIRKLGNELMHEGLDPSDEKTAFALQAIRVVLQGLCT